MMKTDKEKIDTFLKWRKSSIDDLSCGKINKDDFLDLNLKFLKKLDLKPFCMPENISQALYNYQYYNILAKASNDTSLKFKFVPKKKKKYKELISKRENYYSLKDKATSFLISKVDINTIFCYYIDLKSRRLKGKLFEICITSIPDCILHSMNDDILKEIKKKNRFTDEIKKSLIDSYVNKTYKL